MTEENAYQAPQAELTTEENTEARFYIVSSKKFLTLFISTLGVYGIYWFYKNWSLQKEASQSSIWPVMRGIFSIFFTHSLFREVNAHIENQNIDYKWNHSNLATIYVASAIASNVSDRLSAANIGAPFTALLGIAFMAAMIWALYQAQMAINIACNDSEGLSNSHFSMANIAWIIFGVLLWGLILLGISANA